MTKSVRYGSILWGKKTGNHKEAMFYVQDTFLKIALMFRKV